MENERQSSNPERESQFVEPTPDSNAPPDGGLLDEVLRETLTGATEALQPEEFAALEDVARRFSGEKFAVEPAGIALVEALLKLRWEDFDAQDPVWNNLSQSVAGVLFDHPTIEQRLRRLWNGLCEHVR